MKQAQRKTIENWVRDLRSGTFVQSVNGGQLKDASGYCCLGVLCETLQIKPEFEHGKYYFNDGEDEIQSAGLLKVGQRAIGVETSLPSVFGLPLSTLNDAGTSGVSGGPLGRFTFDEIADLLDIALLEGEGIE